MNHSDLKLRQAAQLKVLADFDKFCKEHQLQYFMMYGTLLGAVRHQGFIPWDYDIDTAMTREEYTKFKKKHDLLPSHLSIWEVCYSDIEHAGLARLMYKDKDAGSVCIDIFILDYVNNKQNKFMKALCRLLHFAKLSKNEKQILLNHFKGQPLKQAVVQFGKVLNPLLGGSATIEKLIYNIRVSKKTTPYFITLEGPVQYPVEYFVDSVFLDFDGYKFSAPKEYKKLLQISYGDYTVIPPEGHQWLKEEGLE